MKNLLSPTPDLSLRQGAIAPWAGRNSLPYHQMLDALAQHYHFDINMAFSHLPETVRQVLLYGSGKEKIPFYLNRGGRRLYYDKPFTGVIAELDRRYRETTSNAVRMDLHRYINSRPCPSCLGARLKKESLSRNCSRKKPF